MESKASEERPATRSSRRKKAVNYASLHSSGNRRRKHKATVSRSDSKPSEDQQHPDSRSSASRDKKALQAETEAPDKIGDYPTPIPQLKRRTRSRKKIDYARIHNGNDLFEAQQRQRQQQQQLQQQQQQQQEQQAQKEVVGGEAAEPARRIKRQKTTKAAATAGAAGQQTDYDSATSSIRTESPPEFWSTPSPPLPQAPPGKMNVFISRPFTLPQGANDAKSHEELTRLQRICVECPECRLLLAPVKVSVIQGWCCASCGKFWSTNQDWGFESVWKSMSKETNEREDLHDKSDNSNVDDFALPAQVKSNGSSSKQKAALKRGLSVPVEAVA